MICVTHFTVHSRNLFCVKVGLEEIPRYIISTRVQAHRISHLIFSFLTHGLFVLINRSEFCLKSGRLSLFLKILIGSNFAGNQVGCHYF